jgi:hypothetical protein
MSRFKLEEFAPVKASSKALPRSILLYGPPKRGKTTCAASIVDVPGYERVLVIDVEGGAAAISQWYPEVDVFETQTSEDFDGIIEALVNGKIVEPTSGKPYDCVIIDTLDKAQERKLDWFDRQPEATAKSGEKNTLYKWGAIKTWTTKLADALHMAPFLTIFVAHVTDAQDEKTGRYTQTVALGGSSKDTFPGTPDVVGFYDMAKVKGEGGKTENVRTLDFTLNDKRVTGQRYSDKLDGVVSDPTMEKVYRKIAPELYKK